MRILRSIKEMQNLADALRCGGKTIGFVPTMGALHQGHLSLIRRARRDNDKVVVSIFVNPIQFGPKEDYRRYPRDLSKDVGLCRRAGADVIFLPAAKQMYPDHYKTYVCVNDLSDVLCGKFRPGHFRGVVTVVAKLFNVVRPHVSYFGQKDAQQAIIIRRMVEDLNFGLKIKIMPTLRENDGLAMSSRNAYLNPKERKDAVIIYESLQLAKRLIKQGSRSSLDIARKMKQLINRKKNARLQYISIVDLENLRPLNKIKDRALIALAVWIGKTRLIDNAIVSC